MICAIDQPLPARSRCVFDSLPRLSRMVKRSCQFSESFSVGKNFPLPILSAMETFDIIGRRMASSFSVASARIVVSWLARSLAG